MTTDTWRGVRTWFGGLLGRGRPEAETHHLTRLDRDRDALLAAAPEGEDQLARDLAAAWAVRLQDVADMDQDAGRELLEWVARWRAENPEVERPAAVVRQNAKGSGRSRITQVGGNQTVIRPERS
ncbi:hypothetical protein ACOT81_27430 [Streptomyces sp. WI04-05B]|uniref:hypothetical protein n=1 Tax=Streptomyces TaxID=1883 RepID=UPI0029A7942C|nr:MULTISPECIES: hypothetical protein [unclassified Streptomyces]MDX2546162.1 hypothetical protein [Streptomyces sp. WI04-05B]MDX2587148.1 hypothetical protein [Streptomyces sp. WI04-05A]MDX3750685.1 hypothetical protein [Streptomyces sp. AK08-02]